MLTILSLCLLALIVDVNSECVDMIPGCNSLDEIYCFEPYATYARDVCQKRCGLCDDNSSERSRRGHNHGPEWIDHCWDGAVDHIQDPFCNLLTTTTTTTELPTTTTVPPTTTTAEPTTTTEPPTTTTAEPTTTVEPECFVGYNVSEVVNNTNFDIAVQFTNDREMQNISIHLIGDLDFCLSVCKQSVLNETDIPKECWAFSYNDIDKCVLFYEFGGPLEVLENNDVNTTWLYIDRCKFPLTTTTIRTTTPEPVLTSTLIPTDNGSGRVTTPDMGPPMRSTPGGGTNMGPDTSSSPSGVQIINQNTYQILGLPSPINGTCFFDNRTFALRETWREGCRYDCECINVAPNTAKCTDICPHYDDLAPGCQIVQEEGQCCPIMDCSNATDNTSGTPAPRNCDNKIDTCDYYDDNACVGLYEPWARANCALRCGYCPYKEPCLDRISFCSLYDLDDACPNYPGWARHNCKKTCQICQ